MPGYQFLQGENLLFWLRWCSDAKIAQDTKTYKHSDSMHSAGLLR